MGAVEISVHGEEVDGCKRGGEKQTKLESKFKVSGKNFLTNIYNKILPPRSLQ